MALLHNHKPADLANFVALELKRRSGRPPPIRTLISLFEVMYFASLHTEEGEPVSFHIVYIDPKKPDSKPPKRIRQDRWRVTPFADKIPFSISDCIKLARATDPRTSSLAVYHAKDKKLFIWGLVDQGNRLYDYINFDVESAHPWPGTFQASILGFGRIGAYISSQKIAELRINTLVTNSPDVLWDGPISMIISHSCKFSNDNVIHQLENSPYKDSSFWELDLHYFWITSIARLLRRIQNLRHGGSVLITPDNSCSQLKIKYVLRYSRLRTCLENFAVQQIQSTCSWNYIYHSKDIKEPPSQLFCDNAIFEDEVSDGRSEIDGAIWFISLLSRIDGAVIMDTNLSVLGFGAEILATEVPINIFRSPSPRITKRNLKKVDYETYGTRHRSVFRYCWSVPGSVGFIISQDGQVRAVTRIEDMILLWDDIQLTH